MNRRHFVTAGTLGLSNLGLSWLLKQEGYAAQTGLEKPALEPAIYDLSPKEPPREATAKSMISLFMGGGPSHIDLFDPKPLLERFHGKLLPNEFDVKHDNGGQASKTVMASPYRFSSHGESEIQLSELLPHTADIVDDITLIRSMNLGGIRNHLAGMQAMNFGRANANRPSLGSWLTYGLGSETQELPTFVAIMVDKPPGPPQWVSNGMLPSIYQGTFVRNERPRLLNLDPPEHLSSDDQARQLQLLERLDQRHANHHPQEFDLQARISTYELAARMQTSANEAFDLSMETAETQALYGVNDNLCRPLAEACLIARRLVERGVRFVQIWYYDWDMHERIYDSLPKVCRISDRPSAALVKDLKRRGLLDQTLVHWGGEMGRLPVIQDRGEGMATAGRDHNTDGFSMWLAGGGVRAGHVHGSTDEFGLKAVTDVVHHYDYLATVLHMFGLNAEELVYKQNTRNESILDGQPGKVIDKLLA